jgi:uncharacterized protein YbaR (Trm112 family)
MKWYLQACPVCRGDLHDDVEDRGWVTCFMCGRSYPHKDVLGVQRLEMTEPRPAEELPRAA